MGHRFRSRTPGAAKPDWTDEPEIRLAPDSVAAPPARRHRTNRRVIGLVVVVVAAAIVLGVSRQHHVHRTTAIPTPAAPAPVVEATDAPRGTDRPFFDTSAAAQVRVGNAVLAANGGLPAGLQVDAADQVYVLSTDPPQVTLTTTTGMLVRGARLPAGFGLMALDDQQPYLWLVNATDDTSAVRLYDAPSVTPVAATVTVPGHVDSALAVNGVLWLASTEGLYKLTPHTSAVQVAGVNGPVSAIAFDGAGDRLVVAGGREVGSDVFALDPGTGAVLATGHVPLVGVTLATVQDHLWVAGVGNPDGGGELALLDPGTLRTGSAAAASLGVDAGARVWPGGSVLWAYTNGDGLMSCLSPATGAVLAQWSDLSGPVVSADGVLAAIAVNSVRRLSPTGGCTG